MQQAATRASLLCSIVCIFVLPSLFGFRDSVMGFGRAGY
jgi:hypothetical protein